jgi:HD-like signal output (HDOD) protein/CheY-like chemotaxis protein
LQDALSADACNSVTRLTDSRAALERLAREPCDVLIANSRLADGDGLTLLEKVKQAFPGVIRFVVDGRSDDVMLFRLFDVAHQVVSLPLDVQLVRVLITQTATVLPLVSDKLLRRVIGGVSQLPPAPAVYRELSQLLTEPNCSTDQVVKLIGRDPSIASKLLQLANSAFFSHRGSSVELRSAVVRLGFNTIRHLMLSIELFDANGAIGKAWGRELEIEQRGALKLAQIAEQLARATPFVGDAFVGGLLADIGQVVLLMTQGNVWRECRTESRVSNRPLHVCETLHFGVSHAEVGAYLLGIWGLPYGLIEAVANHHHPERIIAPIYSPSAIVAIAASLNDGFAPAEDWLISLKARTRVDLVRERLQLR